MANFMGLSHAGAGYDARVEQEPGQGHHQDQQHRRADEGERPVRSPGAHQDVTRP
jgi:hypothetical protein